MNQICVVIPSFNVETTIGRVVVQTSQFIDPSQIIVVDDGSCDQTALIAQENGAVVLQNHINRGKGYALKCGFQYAIEEHHEAVITLDGDLQHDPSEIPQFIGHYSRTHADLLMGDRSGDLSMMPLDRQISNRMTSLIISLLTGKRVRDSQCGYRLIKTRILKKIKLISDRYETESELLLKALINGFAITHVPIKTIYNDQQSHIHRFIDTIRFIRIIFHSLISSF